MQIYVLYRVLRMKQDSVYWINSFSSKILRFVVSSIVNWLGDGFAFLIDLLLYLRQVYQISFNTIVPFDIEDKRLHVRQWVHEYYR